MLILYSSLISICLPTYTVYIYRCALLTSIENLIECARYDAQLRVGRLTDLHHQRETDYTLGLVLRLGHVVVQLFVEAIDLYLHGMAARRGKGLTNNGIVVRVNSGLEFRPDLATVWQRQRQRQRQLTSPGKL